MSVIGEVALAIPGGEYIMDNADCTVRMGGSGNVTVEDGWTW